MEGEETTKINTGRFGTLEYFSMYLAGIVVFRVFFATLHTCKWKWRFCCNKAYQHQEINLKKEKDGTEKDFMKLEEDRKQGRHEESSDEE